MMNFHPHAQVIRMNAQRLSGALFLAAGIFTLILISAFTGARSLPGGGGDKVFLLLSEEGNIALVDPTEGVMKRRIQVGSRPEYIALDATGKKAFVSNTKTNTISVVDVAGETQTKIIHIPVVPHDLTLGVLAVNPVKNHIYVAESQTATSSNIWVIDAATETIVTSFDAGPRISNISTTNNGKCIYVANEGSGINVFDAESFKRIASPIATTEKAAAAPTTGKKKTKTVKAVASQPAPGVVRSVACNPKLNKAYVTFGTRNVIEVINTDTHKPEGTITVPVLAQGDQRYISCSPDGAWAFVVNYQIDYKTVNSVLLLKTASNEIVKLFDTGPVKNGISVSSDGALVYIASKSFKSFNLQTFELIRSVFFQTELSGMVTIPG